VESLNRRERYAIRIDGHYLPVAVAQPKCRLEVLRHGAPCDVQRQAPPSIATLQWALAVVLAFGFGYAFTVFPLRRSGMAWAQVLRLALAADTASITIMEIVDNAVMLAVFQARSRRARLGPFLKCARDLPPHRRARCVPGEPLVDRARKGPRDRARASPSLRARQPRGIVNPTTDAGTARSSGRR
jgi:hypothetical protein